MIKQIGRLPHRGHPILLTTCMITDQIGPYSVLLTLYTIGTYYLIYYNMHNFQILFEHVIGYLSYIQGHKIVNYYINP